MICEQANGGGPVEEERDGGRVSPSLSLQGVGCSKLLPSVMFHSGGRQLGACVPPKHQYQPRINNTVSNSTTYRVVLVPKVLLALVMLDLSLPSCFSTVTLVASYIASYTTSHFFSVSYFFPLYLFILSLSVWMPFPPQSVLVISL